MSKSLGDAVAAAVDAIEAARGLPGDDPSLAIARAGEDPTVFHLVYSMLLWEAGHEAALRALESIRAALTGLNELRVCDAEEIAALLPRDIPRRDERAARIFTALNKVFADQHALSLQAVAAMPKREARVYLDGLDGVPPFVAARVMLLSMGGHALPADDRIAAVLLRHGAIDDAAISHADLIGQLERAVRASDSARVYALLELDAMHAAPVKKGSRRSKSKKAGGSPAKRKSKAES